MNKVKDKRKILYKTATVNFRKTFALEVFHFKLITSLIYLSNKTNIKSLLRKNSSNILIIIRKCDLVLVLINKITIYVNIDIIINML